MINKTLYLYWGGRKLSWLRYLTVVSFAKRNPGWKIKVYYPTRPTIGNSWSTDEQIVQYEGLDWFDHLPVYAETIPLDMQDLGFSNDLTEVHKSDIFRLWVLSEFGGLYSDFDIIYTKPMPKLTERLYHYHKDGHYAIGLLAAPKGDKLYKELLNYAKQAPTDKYQAFGATLWDKVTEQPPEGLNMPQELVYSYDWQQAENLFVDNKELPKGAIGVHWFGGSIVAGQWENKITPQSQYDSTIGNLIKEYQCSQ